MSRNFAQSKHAGIRLIGFSLAGEETFVAAPELNVCFDIGRAPREVIAIDHILLSHAHMDHAAGIAYYFSQRMFLDNEPGHLFAPEPLIDPIQRLLNIWGELDGNVPPANLHAAHPGEIITLRRDLAVRPFRVNHTTRLGSGVRVDALGYTLVDVRQKLKDEYIGLDGVEIVELKKQGVQITRQVEVPLVTYCGDTGPGDFLTLDHVRNSKVLVIECTFVEEDHRHRARAGNHMHLADLREIIPTLNNEHIILNHLSRRTRLSDARRLVRAAIGEEQMSRVSFLTVPTGRRRQDHQEQ
jgi:ribonuclease Z